MKKINVTIGVSAYNEESNIGTALSSILDQKNISYKISEIIVISDGSTDSTVRKAKEIKSKKIRVINSEKRYGKAERLTQIFRIAKGEAIVIVDADMKFDNKMSIEYLLRGFKRKNVHFVTGNTVPVEANTFLEAAINNYKKAREEVRKSYDTEQGAYGVHGYVAYSKEFAKKVRIPSSVLNDDAYSYFKCLRLGYKHYFEKKATVNYRSPQNIKDHIKQSKRHLKGGVQMLEYFTEDEVQKGFYIPKNILVKIMIKQILKSPLGYVYLKTLNFYCGYMAAHTSRYSVLWEQISTSKKIL